MVRALAWGDELCGQVVTPESWATMPDGSCPEKWGGGLVVNKGGHWLSASRRNRPLPYDKKFPWHLYGIPDGIMHRKDEYPGDYAATINRPEWGFAYMPIFPPRGWAGKTDAELWEAVFGDGWLELDSGIHIILAGNGEPVVAEYSSSIGRTIIDPASIQQGITDRQNIAVLQARLRSTT